MTQYAVLLHPVPEDGDQRATVIRSDDNGETWFAMADACPENADEIAGALQWASDCRDADGRR